MKSRFLVIIGVIIMATVPFATFAVLDRYENYLEQLEYERQRIENEPKPGERSYIEPELKAKLEGVELDLREKVRQLHEDLPPSSYAVNLNHQTKEIEAVIENKELIPIIKEFTKKYPEDIIIVVEYGKITLVDNSRCGEKYLEVGNGECELNPKPSPEPSPEPIPDSESLQQQKQQARRSVQETVMLDTRVHDYKINVIRDYRDEFESGYFLEQFIRPNKENFNKDNVMHFVYSEWGYQPKENTDAKIEVYFRSYENYDKIEKINEWQKPQDHNVFLISPDSDGYLMMDSHGMFPATGIHETCMIPGEYRVSASHPTDKSKVEWGYFTCQRDKLVGEPQPWMELPK